MPNPPATDASLRPGRAARRRQPSSAWRAPRRSFPRAARRSGGHPDLAQETSQVEAALDVYRTALARELG
jgi:hypothetical protein